LLACDTLPKQRRMFELARAQITDLTGSGQ
jgi:hypothetical protein